MSDQDRAQRRYEREKKARLQAEEILEQKSRELFEKNLQLKELSEGLEHLVVERTKELQIARDEALAAAVAKSEFLANMSHELRTPLNGVLGMLSVLERTQLTETQQKHLGIVRSSGELLLSVINDILDFSKLEADKMELESIAILVSSLLTETLEPLAILAKEKHIELRYEADSLLPEKILGDPTRLKQVMTNLTSNAIKFTGQGEVTVRLQKNGDHYQIMVRDTGIGMNEGQRNKIFDAFSQADSSISRTHGGTGLGLSITKRLVDMMDGTIGVTSEPGEGSLFTVTLPLKEPSAEHLAEQQPKPKQEINFQGQRILLAEDNPINQQIASHQLSYMGLNMVTAHNGVEAIEMMKRQEFDLVLMDMQMPVMDGLEATWNIRALGGKYQYIPIIAMTAHAGHEYEQQCIDAGMNDYISKPINFNDLADTLSHWLNQDQSSLNQDQAINNEVQQVRQEIESQKYDPCLGLAETLPRINHNWPLMFRILKNFSETYRNSVSDIRQKLDDRDIDAVFHKLHSLNSSADSIGAVSVTTLTDRVMVFAKQNYLEPIKELLPTLESVVNDVISHIDQMEDESGILRMLCDDQLIGEKLLSFITHIDKVFEIDPDKAKKLVRELSGQVLKEPNQSLIDQIVQAIRETDLDRAQQLLLQRI